MTRDHTPEALDLGKTLMDSLNAMPPNKNSGMASSSGAESKEANPGEVLLNSLNAIEPNTYGDAAQSRNEETSNYPRSRG